MRNERSKSFNARKLGSLDRLSQDQSIVRYLEAIRELCASAPAPLVELEDVVAKGPTPELPRVFALPAKSPEAEVLQIGPTLRLHESGPPHLRTRLDSKPTSAILSHLTQPGLAVRSARKGSGQRKDEPLLGFGRG